MWTFLRFRKIAPSLPRPCARPFFAPRNTSDGQGFDLLVSLGDLIPKYGAAATSANLERQTYLTDLGKCAPHPRKPKGKLEDEEFRIWYQALLAELGRTPRPRVGVTFGGARFSDS